MDTVHPVLLLSALVAAWACSPLGYRVQMDKMAHMAPIIAYGRVMQRFPDAFYHDSYTAEVEVKCTYKGGPIPERINISHAGMVPGMCGNKNFTVGLEYIVFLRQDGATYTHMYDDTKEATAAMDELMTFCDLRLDYPTNATNQTTCPTKQVNAGGCHRYIPPYAHPMPPAPETSSTGPSTHDATDEIIVGIVTTEPTKAAEARSHNDGTIVSLSAVCVVMTTLCSLFIQ